MHTEDTTSERNKTNKKIVGHEKDRRFFCDIGKFIPYVTKSLRKNTYCGAFPTWLSPEQVRVLPISDKYLDYANQVNAKLNEEGIRSSVDSRAEKIGYKIRDARLMKVPYMLIVGAKEEEQGLVSVRSRFAGDEGQTELASFVDSIKEEVRTRTLRETIVVEEEKKEK